MNAPEPGGRLFMVFCFHRILGYGTIIESITLKLYKSGRPVLTLHASFPKNGQRMRPRR